MLPDLWYCYALLLMVVVVSSGTAVPVRSVSCSVSCSVIQFSTVWLVVR
jgi:hypothetical protein